MKTCAELYVHRGHDLVGVMDFINVIMVDTRNYDSVMACDIVYTLIIGTFLTNLTSGMPSMVHRLKRLAAPASGELWMYVKFYAMYTSFMRMYVTKCAPISCDTSC